MTEGSLRKKADALALWIGLAFYVVVGFGGGWLFSDAVRDAAWQETFFLVWWLPSGAAAWWVKSRIEAWLRK